MLFLEWMLVFLICFMISGINIFFLFEILLIFVFFLRMYLLIKIGCFIDILIAVLMYFLSLLWL